MVLFMHRAVVNVQSPIDLVESKKVQSLTISDWLGAHCTDSLSPVGEKIDWLKANGTWPSGGTWFFSEVDTAEQAAFLVEGCDGCQEMLQALEVCLTFDCDEGASSVASGFAPASCDKLSIRS
jgi:hypothetical protein